MIPLEAELALEWWRASGEKSPERLRSIVNHFLDVRAVKDSGRRAATLKAAMDSRYSWEREG